MFTSGWYIIAKRRLWWMRVHGARTVRTVWGNDKAFTPQMDPHRKVLDSKIGTKKTAKKWVLLHQFVAVSIESGLSPAK